MAFYKRLSSVNRAEYAQYGTNMVRLVEKLADELRIEGIGAHIEMLDLALYIEGFSRPRVEVSWVNDSYIVTLNSFEDSESVSYDEIVSLIRNHLMNIGRGLYNSKE